MTHIGLVKRLLSRRIILLHLVLLASGLFGVLAWLLVGEERWLTLPLAALATAILLLGIQLQFAVDTVQTLKNNEQKRHVALRSVIHESGSNTATRLNEQVGEVNSKLQVLAGEQKLKAAKLSSQWQSLSDQQGFRFAELIDLYQDQADRQVAFETRFRNVIEEGLTEHPEDGAFDELPENEEAIAVDSSLSGLCLDALLEDVWPSVQNHMWIRDLYARSGAIAPRGFLASPETMKVCDHLAQSEALLVDWGIDSLTFHLVEERARLGMTTIAIEPDDRLADVATQALGGQLQTVSTGMLAAHELGRELQLLISEPAGLLVSGRLSAAELTKFAAVLKDLHLIESVYLTSVADGVGELTTNVLDNAGFSRTHTDDENDAGIKVWQRFK